ncbi:uncharacterized protein LOC131147183 [Malania oleifera]|uniref:uncharacterized protein LOC131147183 n=1 Tax=Malania oleifera TaxID=397392 RepID=UPI0025AE3A9D|nr:uncharacterized protein LOC131147183 [Malania oleifera]
MGEGTRMNQMLESIAGLRRSQEEQQITQAEQQKLLNTVTQQLGALSDAVKNLGKQKLDQEGLGETSSHDFEYQHRESFNGEQHRAGIQTKTVRVDFPKFNGSDPAGWLYTVNHFFLFHETPPHQRVLLASFHMEDKALIWFQDLERSGLLTSWETFERALHTRFGVAPYDDSLGQLSNLKLTSFKEQFEELSNRVRDLDEGHQLSLFMGGLKEEIRWAVKLSNPINVHMAYGKARIQEENLLATKKYIIPKHSTPSHHLAVTKPATKPNTQVHKYSPEQIREKKKSKGLCFNCDAKWHPGHKCGAAKLFLLEGNELNCFNEEGESPEFVGHDCSGEVGVEQQPGEDKVEITLHALTGSPHYKTMRVVGCFRGQSFVILVDTRSTHNFIDPALVRRLKLTLDSGEKVKVKVANGEEIRCEGRCRAVSFVVQGTRFEADMYSLVLGGCDIVLGILWLSTLGKIMWNFVELTIKLHQNGQTVCLKGLTFQALVEEEVEGKLSYLERKGILLQPLEGIKEEARDSISQPLTSLLDEFQQVFAEPRGLPPIRSCDHGITLKEGTSPISVRPYRYPYFQKEEIERIVRELLELGTIRPSHSP